MTDSNETKTPFVDRLWNMPEEAMIQAFIVSKHAGDPASAMAILQAKALRATEETAKATRELAKSTGSLARSTAWLAAMTAVLAVATVILVLVTMTSN